MKARNSFFFLVLGSLLMTSCAITPKTTVLRPVSGQIATIDGRDVTQDIQNNIQVVAAYEGPFFDYYLFDIEVKNKTNEPWTLYPADFYGQSVRGQNNAAKSNYFTQLDVIDPRQRMGEVELSMKRAKRRRTVNTIVNVGLMVGNVALATSGRSHSQNDYWQRAAQFDAGSHLIWTKQVVDNERYNKMMYRLTNEKGLLQTDALAETTIQPGQSARGLLLVKADPKANSINLLYPVSDAVNIAFEFEQKAVKLRR